MSFSELKDNGDSKEHHYLSFFKSGKWRKTWRNPVDEKPSA